MTPTITSRYVLWSQLALLITLIICVVIRPAIVFSKNQGGLSNYGTEMPTLLFFSAGLWICIGLLVTVLYRLKNHSLSWVLLSLILGYGLLTISTYPYKINELFENIHILVGFFVALLQLVLATFIAIRLRFDGVARVALCIMILGVVVGILTAIQTINQLFTAQFISAIGFGIIFIHAFKMKID